MANQENENESRPGFFARRAGKITIVVIIVIVALVIVFLVLWNRSLRQSIRDTEETVSTEAAAGRETEEEESLEAEEPEMTEEPATEEETVREGAVQEASYILPESDTRYYTASELSDLSKDQLRLARNEIYARHGRKFDSQDLQSYFDGQAWYQGTVEPSAFSESVLNAYEKANVSLIQSLEDGSAKSGSGTQSTQSTEASGDNEELFLASWDVIQSNGLYQYDWLNHTTGGTTYSYSSLYFAFLPESLVDMGDYYFIRAVFSKPLTITADLVPGQQYTVCTDELSGIYKTLTCYEGEYGYYLTDNTGEIYDTYPDNRDAGRLVLFYDTDDCRYTDFYNGVLRIRKDAVYGASITYGPYRTVDVQFFFDYYGINGAAFDGSGYVTQLLSLGD